MEITDVVMDRSVRGRVNQDFFPLGNSPIELTTRSKQVGVLLDLALISLKGDPPWKAESIIFPEVVKNYRAGLNSDSS